MNSISEERGEVDVGKCPDVIVETGGCAGPEALRPGPEAWMRVVGTIGRQSVEVGGKGGIHGHGAYGLNFECKIFAPAFARIVDALAHVV